jgi:hypothetical protein
MAAQDGGDDGVAPTEAASSALMASHDAFLRARSAVFDALCAGHPVSVGKLASTSERHERGLTASTLIYGEIVFLPFALTFLKIKALYGGLPAGGAHRFIDIGSGTGKPVFAAALLHDFAEVRGVEVLEGLHAISLDLAAVWRSPGLQALLTPAQRATRVELVRGDATAPEVAAAWASADLLFMNSTCFDEALMAALARLADGMPVGAFAITFTKALPSGKWRVLESEVFAMTWGAATIFIHRKELP